MARTTLDERKRKIAEEEKQLDALIAERKAALAKQKREVAAAERAEAKRQRAQRVAVIGEAVLTVAERGNPKILTEVAKLVRELMRDGRKDGEAARPLFEVDDRELFSRSTIEQLIATMRSDRESPRADEEPPAA